MSRKGVTLLELMMVVLLIPIVGFTVVQLDFLTHTYFYRTTRGMISEQEVEIALGAIARDVVAARAIAVCDLAWVPVAVGATESYLELVVDDNNDIPPDPTNDDVIRYSLDTVTGTILRQYDTDSSGVFDFGQVIARNVTGLEFTQTTEQPPATENLPTPQNVVRVRVVATFGQTTVDRTRYVTSRAMRAIP